MVETYLLPTLYQKAHWKLTLRKKTYNNSLRDSLSKISRELKEVIPDGTPTIIKRQTPKRKPFIPKGLDISIISATAFLLNIQRKDANVHAITLDELDKEIQVRLEVEPDQDED